MWTPEPGQDVEVIIRGRVKQIGCKGHVALVERLDGRVQHIEITGDLLGAVEWREAA